MYAWYVVAFEGKQEASRSDISYFYWKNCPENNSSGNTSNQDPILTNKAKKGVQYHQMPLFDQPIPVTVTEKNLNISYIATAKGKTVLARLEDENGKVIITRELQVGAGYNFFSLQPSEWKMINTKHHVLTLMNENGERQSLYFWYRPKS